jgi:hypothetical protein
MLVTQTVFQHYDIGQKFERALSSACMSKNIALMQSELHELKPRALNLWPTRETMPTSPPTQSQLDYRRLVNPIALEILSLSWALFRW